MDGLSLIAAGALATVLQLPFHLVLASPFIAAAWLAWRLGRRSLGKRRLVAFITAIAAAGLAPAYGAHLSMLPAYTLLLGGSLSWRYAAVSFAITWLVLGALVSMAISNSPSVSRAA